MINRDEGNVSILVCAICFVILIISLGVAGLGNAQITKVKVQNAADAAALSAAYEISVANSQKACNSARNSASKNNAKVTSCKVTLDNVKVEVSDLGESVFAQARAEVD